MTTAAYKAEWLRDKRLISTGQYARAIQLTQSAIGQGSAACGASPAPKGCASGGEE